jgi:hypothetical protein
MILGHGQRTCQSFSCRVIEECCTAATGDAAKNQVRITG